MLGKAAFRLTATPLSHFARKVRILLDLYGASYEFVDIGAVAFTKTPKEAGGNPLLKVPVLEHNGNWLIESDHIAGYVVDQCDASDRYKVFTRNIDDLNIRAALNGIMTEEVKVITARRHKLSTENVSYFNRAMSSITNGLEWLEANHGKFNIHQPGYKEFHLLCMWDHLDYYDFLPLSPYKHLQHSVRALSANGVLNQTAPRVLVPK